MTRQRTGRPRRYCRRSHRQRAYEARRAADRRGLAAGEALVSEASLRALNDRLYVLETALDDAGWDLALDRDHRAAYEHLRAAAEELRGMRLEPSAVRDA